MNYTPTAPITHSTPEGAIPPPVAVENAGKEPADHGSRGWLRNGNPPGSLENLPQCGAKTRRGTKCRCPAMRNGRCRLHGGLSTGPKTPEGRARCAKAAWKHGRYSAETKALKRRRRTRARVLAALDRAATAGLPVGELCQLLEDLLSQTTAGPA
jgi:hypothetical protein